MGVVIENNMNEFICLYIFYEFWNELSDKNKINTITTQKVLEYIAFLKYQISRCIRVLSGRIKINKAALSDRTNFESSSLLPVNGFQARHPRFIRQPFALPPQGSFPVGCVTRRRRNRYHGNGRDKASSATGKCVHRRKPTSHRPQCRRTLKQHSRNTRKL